jgi:Zn-dependent alcohol dehydrogenase
MQLEMRAVYTKAYYQLEVRERVVPDPGPGEVQLQITACSICTMPKFGSQRSGHYRLSARLQEANQLNQT